RLLHDDGRVRPRRDLRGARRCRLGAALADAGDARQRPHEDDEGVPRGRLSRDRRLAAVGGPGRAAFRGCAGRAPGANVAALAQPQHGSSMRITAIHDIVAPMSSSIRNAYIDFSTMTTSVV